MKKVVFFLLSVSALISSCSKSDVTIPVKADFTATVTGQSPNAQITIVNNTTGAETYSWTFGKGSSLETSSDKNPGVITVDKVGDLLITLDASKGGQKQSQTVTVAVTGNNAVVSYSDIEFGLSAGSATYGRLFSFETGKIYKDSEINSTIGPKINLAFGSQSNTMYYFESPTSPSYSVPNAVNTEVMNYPNSSSTITTANFDAMTDDSKLASLTIAFDNNSFGNSSIPGTVLFKLSTGRKGVIKTKAVNSSRLLVDIKIQKY